MIFSYQILKYVCGLTMTILGHNFPKYKIYNNGIIVFSNTYLLSIYYVLSAVLTFIGAPGQ